MTKTEIANIALAKFREGRITNIESTTDPVAVVMNDQYDHALELVLEEHRWNFAGKRVTLTQLSDAPPFGWDHQYQLPSDIIRLKDVNGEDVEASSRLFAIEGTALLTNDDTVTITYIAKVTDTNLFSPSFVEALCFKLASITCARLTGDTELAIMLDKQYNYALSKAVHNDTKAAGSRDRNLMQRLMDSAPILGGSYRYPSSGSAGGGSSSSSGTVPAHKHGLTDLLQSSATDGQTIVWNATEERWEAGDAGGASPLTTKGDIFAYDTDDARLPVGTDGQFLKADSTQPTGLKWETASGTGDLLASNNLSELTPTASTARSNLGLGTAATSNTGDFAAASHTHATTDITSGTMADARIAQSNVTQHEAALTITPTQIDSTGSADETILTSDGVGNATFDTLASQTTIKDIQETGSNTGLVDGGILSIGTGGAGVATTFSISDGHGYVLDLSTPSSPVCTKVSWTGKTDIAVTNIGSQLITFVCINSAGTVVQSGSRWMPEDYRDCIILGVVVHVDKTTVDAVNQSQWAATYGGANLADLFEVLKFVNFSGNLLSGNPNGSLNLQKSVGTLFGRGVNFSNSKTKPNHLTMAATGTGAGDLSQFQYRLSDGTYGTGGDAPYALLTNQSVHPTRYESSAGVLSTVSPNKFTAQRVFLFTSGNIKVQYGIAEYANFTEAKAALGTEPFVVEPSIEANGLFLGYLIVQESCTDLTDPADALFIQANKFGDAPSGGGAGGASDHGLLVGLLDDDHTQYSLISSQAGAPTSTPTRVGEINIDTTNDNAYVSIDTTLPSDWVQIDGAGGGSVATDAIWDAAGDLAIGTGADTAARLAIGTNGQVLTSNGTTAVWGAAGAGTVDTSGTPVLNDFARFTDADTIEGRSYAEVRADLSLEIGTDVQAYDAGLTDIAGLAVTDGNVIVGNGANWVAESGATARTSLGLGNVEDTALSTWAGSTNITTTGTVTTGTWSSALGTVTGTIDAGGATSLEIPNGAAPVVNAAGEIAIDTTITDHTGAIKYHDGVEELQVVALPLDKVTVTDGHVIAYNATNNEFEMVAAGAADNLGNHTATQDLNMAGFNVDSADSIYLDEKAAADVDVVGDGQLWVKDSSPNRLMFTDDTGQDFEMLHECMGFACSDETTLLTSGEKVVFYAPYDMLITSVYASLVTAPTTQVVTVDVESPAGISLLTSALSIATSTFTAEETGMSKAVAKGARVSVDIDQADTGAAAGLKVFITHVRT